jgi:hypothetical protein
MSPTKILNLDLGSLSRYLVKPGLGLFSHILDWRQAVCKLHEAQCDLSNHSRALRLTLKDSNGRQGFGPTKAESDLVLASASASLFLWIPQYSGTYTSRTQLDKASSWESLHCSTTLEDKANDLRASKAALLSEQIDTALLTMPSEMQYSEHAKIAYISDWKTVVWEPKAYDSLIFTGTSSALANRSISKDNESIRCN